MQEPYEKGIANHSAPSFAADAVKPPLKRKQGHRWAGYRKIAIGTPTLSSKRKAMRTGAPTQVPGWSCVVVDPTHVWKLHTREPGDLGGA